MNIPESLLQSHKWSPCSNESDCYYRSHDVGPFLWTEEIRLSDLSRATHIRIIISRGDPLGKTIEAAAPAIAQMASQYYPMRRTGIGKMRTYFQAESLAKFAGSILGEDRIDDERLFLVRASISERLENVICRDSRNEAQAHVYLMLSLQSPVVAVRSEPE